jgi:DNA repair exonuclease SbcCD ATPase subunit
MMLSEKIVPIIILKKLMVFRNGGIAYDQKFKYGVNIIRGDNGTGKSSVMDFLYYGLGAEITEWNEHQAKCTHTLIEVMFNYKSMCLKREITDTGKAPMFIYDGAIDKALSDEENWFRYPNARNKETHSYSQQIFELLGLPSHKTDDASNLTMHQILRLMYVDQLTDPTKLLKDDKKYDNATIRRAIGEFLLGIDDLEAHNLRQDLIEANRKFDAYNSELKAIYRFLGMADSIIRKEQLNSELKTTKAKIISLEEMRSNVRNEKLEVLSDKVKTKAKEISSELVLLSVEISSLQEKRSVLNSELIDTGLFVDSLSSRKKALEQSKLTNASLGDMIFKYCPSCLSLLKEHDDENSCSLCKTELNESHRHYAYMQMVNEINFQLRESESLLTRYRAELREIESVLPNMSDKLDRLKSEYNNLISNGDTVDAALSEFGAEIGFHRSQINHLNEKVRMVDQVEELIDKKSSANDAITKLKDSLALLEEGSKNRVDEVYSSIEGFSKELISSDGGYENIFDNPDEVTFDFARDKMAVNGRSKFSASSMVIMKNSIRAAIFIHSVGDKKTRLPRFILMDNMEDKGMTAERSQNFQRVLVERCDELEEDYQIIFTTSMIDKELNKSDYVVGPFYKKGEHTLQLA